MSSSASLFAISNVPSLEPESTMMISTSAVCERSDASVRSIVSAESRERTIALASALTVLGRVSHAEVDQTRSDRPVVRGDEVGPYPPATGAEPLDAAGEGPAAPEPQAIAA